MVLSPTIRHHSESLRGTGRNHLLEAMLSLKFINAIRKNGCSGRFMRSYFRGTVGGPRPGMWMVIWLLGLILFRIACAPSRSTICRPAKYESLDNSPLYDDVPFNPVTHTMDLADVSLMSYYVMDCDALSKIAAVLGRTGDVEELQERSGKYAKRLATMWDDDEGIYLNKRLSIRVKSHTGWLQIIFIRCLQRWLHRSRLKS